MQEADRTPSLTRRSFIGAAGVAGTLLANPSAARAARRRDWQPDGANLPRIGIAAAAHDFNPESEMAMLNRGRVSLYASRMPIRFTREFLTDPTHADTAIDLLMALQPRAILYPSTSTSYYLGVEGERAFHSRLEARTKSTPVIFPATALVEAARMIGARRIALVHPPWFKDPPHEAGAAYFRAQGFDLVSSKRITPAREFSEVPAREAHDWIVANTPKEAEAVIQGGNGLRAIGAIDALERSLGRPVITANQALFWQGLRAAGVRRPLDGYGRLLKNFT
jgi:maleate isomerase